MVILNYIIIHNFSIGWAHGVLNTDNMSLASVTIDYGPFGFVDAYDPNFTPNHSDDMGKFYIFKTREICIVFASCFGMVS